MYYTITRSVRFGMNPQALAMKQALLKREEALAYRADYQATLDRFSYSQDDELLNEMLRENFPKQAVSDALFKRLTDMIENVRYYHREKSAQTFGKELLLMLRKKIAGSPMPPPPNSPGSNAVRHLIQNYLKQNTISSKDLSQYRPVFHEQDEALFLQTLKEMVKNEESGNHRSNYDWANQPRVHSIPLLIDIIDYAQTNPPNNTALNTPQDIEIFAKPLVKMATDGAPAFSMSPVQKASLNNFEVTYGLIDLLQKKGFLVEDGVKLLPDNLANALCEMLAKPEGVAYANSAQPVEEQPTSDDSQDSSDRYNDEL